MTPEKYLATAAFAGRWLDRPQVHAERFGVCHQCANRNAVYIICDYSGAIVYVGSTRRGVGTRVGEHFADQTRTHGWSQVWTIPLKSNTPNRHVRRIEGLVGLYLSPRESRALPTPL